MVPKVPLAEATGGIAFVLKHFSNGDFLGIQAMDVTGKEHDVAGALGQADPLRVASRHKGGPGGTANRRGNVEGCELHAFFGHPVEMRRFVLCRAEGADVAIAHVVNEDHDEVGLGHRREGEGNCKSGEEKCA